MAITVPEKLAEIYLREYNDMYKSRFVSEVDDLTGCIIDPSKGQLENTFRLTSEKVNGAMPFVPDALKEPIQELMRLKHEAMERCFIRETEPDFEEKRYEGILSRIATFSGSANEKAVAKKELERLGKPVSNDLMKIAYIDEVLPVLIGQVDPTLIHIDEVSNNLKQYGVDITPYMPLIGVKAPDRIVYDGSPAPRAKYPIYDANKPNDMDALSDAEMVKLETLNQADGIFHRTFDTLTNNLPDGISIFDTLYINGERFSDHYASNVIGLNKAKSDEIFRALFANCMFSGTSKIECCPIDKDYNVGEPIRVSTGKNVFLTDPPRPMNPIRRFFVNRGFFKEFVNRDIRQDKLFKESDRAKTSRHSKMKQKLAEKAVEAKQAKETAIEAKYNELLPKAKAAQLAHAKKVTAQYNQYFKKEDFAVLEGANEKMGLNTLTRQASALSFARIALLAKGFSMQDILSSTALETEKNAIGRELIEKINEGDQKYFQDMFKEAGLKLKDVIIPEELNTREELIKSYSSLKDLQSLAIDFQQIKLSAEKADYDVNLTLQEQEEIDKNADKLGAITKLAAAYTEALIEAEDEPAPMTIVNTAVKATIALNLPIKTDIMHRRYSVKEIDIPEGYKGIGDMVSMNIATMKSDQRDKIVNDCVNFIKSPKSSSPIGIDGEFMPILKDSNQRLSLFSEPQKAVPTQTRRRVSLDLGTTKSQNLTTDPKTTAPAPKAEISQPKV